MTNDLYCARFFFLSLLFSYQNSIYSRDDSPTATLNLGQLNLGSLYLYVIIAEGNLYEFTESAYKCTTMNNSYLEIRGRNETFNEQNFPISVSKIESVEVRFIKIDEIITVRTITYDV